VQAPDSVAELADDQSDHSGGDLVVAGINVQLFAQNPSWQVRGPKKFAGELLARTLRALDPKANGQPCDDQAELLVRALVGLLSSQPHLVDIVHLCVLAFASTHSDSHASDQVSSQGYVPVIVHLLKDTGALAPLWGGGIVARA